MKKFLLTTLLIFSSTILLFGQKTFENKLFGFSIEEPKDWIPVTNRDLLDNQKKYQRSDEELAKLLEKDKGAILLAAYYKYDAKKHAGLIPVIQIYVRSYTPKSFPVFKNEIIQSTTVFKTYYEDFEFIQEPAEIEISGIKSVYFVSKYTWKGKNGVDLKAKSRTYAIPYKNYFFQVGFNDGQTEEDSTELFDKLLKTIKIGSLQY